MIDILVKRVSDDADLEAAFGIREEVFMKGQNISREDEFDDYDAESRHYLGLIGNEPAGAARWRRTTDGIKLERFCVLPQFRGQGLAKLLLKEVMHDVMDSRKIAEKIYLHAQVDVVSLYSAEGFAPEGDVFLECEILHQTMVYLNKKSSDIKRDNFRVH